MANSFSSVPAYTLSWLYAAAFGRTPVPSATAGAGDANGLDYWTNQYLGGPGAQAGFINNVYAIANFFTQSAEFLAEYPTALTNEQFVTELYLNQLGRNPDPAGLDFWVGKLVSGQSRGQVLADFSNVPENQNANPTRKAAIENYIVYIANDPDHLISDAEAATWLANNPGYDAAVVDSQGSGGQTYVLKIGQDTATASTFEAPTIVTGVGANVQTLETIDKLSGSGTTDVLNATLNSAINVKPTLIGIETINLTTIAASNLDLGAATGVKTVTHIASVAGADLTALNIANIVDVAVQSSAAGGGTDSLFQFQSAVLSGTTDTVKVALTANGTATAASGNINVAGLGSGVAETLDVTVSGTNRITSLSSDVNAGLGATTATNGATTYKFSGDGSIRIDTQLTNATTVNGSGLTTGGMRVIVDPAKVVTVTGGKGADFVDFQAGLTNADKYDGGDGRDTLVTSAPTNTGLTTGHGISNVEILQVGGTTTAGVASTFTVDSDVTTSFDAFVHNSTAAMTYTNTVGANMADATKGLTILNNGAITLNIKGADGLGSNSDALYIAVGNTTGATGAASQSALQTAGGVAAGALTTNSIETITLQVNADTSGQTALGIGVITDATLATLNIKGGAAGEAFLIGAGGGLTAGASSALGLTSASLTKIDASAFAGNLSLSGTATGQNIIGGSGNDTLATGGSAAFGAAVPADMMTGGAGQDIFSYTTSDAALTGANLTTMDALATAKFIGMQSITDLNLGTGVAAGGVDRIDLAAVGGANTAGTLGFNANVVTVVNGGAVTAMTGANLGAAVNTLVKGGTLDGGASAAAVFAGLFSFGGETYLIAAQQAVAGDNFGAVASADIIIRVTGVVGTLDASDFTSFTTGL